MKKGSAKLAQSRNLLIDSNKKSHPLNANEEKALNIFETMPQKVCRTEIVEGIAYTAEECLKEEDEVDERVFISNSR